MFKRLTVGLVSLSLLIVTGVVGCAQSGGVAARVNGRPIYLKDIDRQIDDLKQKHATIFSGSGSKELEKEWRKRILEVFIDEELKYRDAVQAGIKVPEAEVEKKMMVVKSAFKNEADYKKALSDEKITEDELKQNVMKRIAVQWREDEVARGNDPTTEDIEHYYQANRESFKIQPGEYQPLDEVAGAIAKTLGEKNRARKLTKWFTRLKKKARIERFI